MPALGGGGMLALVLLFGAALLGIRRRGR
ncbi:hypothetical protein JW905_06015 [bacterium]|nr:hypothetical protein [candidate division CSSED10-310 bacterium]